MKLRRREKAALLALVAYAVCCGCAHTRAETHDASADMQAKVQTGSEAKTADDSHEERVEGPREVLTDKQQLGVVVLASNGDITIARVGRKPLTIPNGAKVIGTVPLAETRRDDKQTAAVDVKDTHTSSEADTASTATLAEKTAQSSTLKTSTHAGPPWWAYALAGLALAGAAALLWKLKPPWLGWLWKLTG